METRQRQDIDTMGVRSSAIHHREGVTLTIEIPADALNLDNTEDRFGFGAALIATTFEALQAPRPGTLRMIRGGRA